VRTMAICGVSTAAALMMVGLCAFTQSNPLSSVSRSEIDAKPLLLERNEGESRTRRIHIDKSLTASSQFMLKVSPKNNGSQHLVAGTEEVAPGATLPKHRHLVQDEIVLVYQRNRSYLARRSGTRSACWRACVHSGEYMDKCEERRHRTGQHNVYLLSPWIRGDNAVQFRAGW